MAVGVDDAGDGLLSFLGIGRLPLIIWLALFLMLFTLIGFGGADIGLAHAAGMTMNQLHEQRADFVQKVQQASSSDLAMNGLELESVSLTGSASFGGNGAGGNIGSGNLASDAVAAALSYRAQAPIIDGLMKELGLDGSSLETLVAGAAKNGGMTISESEEHSEGDAAANVALRPVKSHPSNPDSEEQMAAELEF